MNVLLAMLYIWLMGRQDAQRVCLTTALNVEDVL